MNNLQKMGGIAALIDAVTYVVAFGLLFTLMSPFAAKDPDFGKFMTFVMDNQALIYIWHLTMYLVNGIFLVVLALALHERLKVGAPAMILTATAFGLIWAVLVFAGGLIANHTYSAVIDLYGKDPTQAATVWLALDAVETGINSSDMAIGSLWVLLISWAALRTGGFPRALNCLGVVIGVAGFVGTIIPPLKDLVFVFGLGIIVWWAWLGIVMLRNSPNTAAQ